MCLLEKYVGHLLLGRVIDWRWLMKSKLLREGKYVQRNWIRTVPMALSEGIQPMSIGISSGQNPITTLLRYLQNGSLTASNFTIQLKAGKLSGEVSSQAKEDARANEFPALLLTGAVCFSLHSPTMI
ncbi:hypothetical protein BT93_G1470 [Corymbia citriodora subsp. variegata]|nr:hypothetical protein BT93_G1470 [Corymbia citriodora subsp. variegata]